MKSFAIFGEENLIITFLRLDSGLSRKPWDLLIPYIGLRSLI